ncbi:hypothetical protein N0V90_009187 [Kalmusia sp. IMI 367209]|nr:hypothetical protein N0V90_009187 [Kalmusia sp. IMI 367209]
MKSLALISLLLAVAAAAPVTQSKAETKRTNFEIDTILDVNRDPEKSSYATTAKRINFEIDTILDINRPEKSSYATE